MRIIESWPDWEARNEYYLRSFLPSIRSSAELTIEEWDDVERLREELSPELWLRLPEILAAADSPSESRIFEKPIPSALKANCRTLLGRWSDWESNRSFYLEDLIPSIVGTPRISSALRQEFVLLRGALTPKGWGDLPAVFERVWAEKLQRDSEAREAEKRDREAAEERARRSAENHERWKRRETERRKLEALEEERRRRELELARKRELKEEDLRIRELALARERARIESEQQRQKEERKARRARELEERKGALRLELLEVFRANYLGAGAVIRADPRFRIFSAEDLEEVRAAFVEEALQGFFPEPMSKEQCAAVGAVGGDIQVIARAGSGKTRTLVARAVFLLRHCGVTANQILLLAFNSSAAAEMEERLRQALGKDLPHVMTFHALAHALVHPEQRLIHDESGGVLERSRHVQEAIDNHIRSEEFAGRVRELMLAYFRCEWEAISAKGLHLSQAESLVFRRSLPSEALRGHRVRSFGEKVIANTLFEHGVSYEYEKSFSWSGVNYRPDFFLPEKKVVVEYFGLKGDPEYDESCSRKRLFWATRSDYTLLEYEPSDLASEGPESFAERLIGDITALGIKCRKLSDEEIWELISDRAIDRFSQVMTAFVGRCRRLNLSPGDLEDRLGGHKTIAEFELWFLEVGVSVYREYLERLADAKEEDFDGLMWRAVEAVKNGTTMFVRKKGSERGDLKDLRFVMVDEFQDFSEVFAALLREARDLNPEYSLYCVGDDWQAINGFAGSDLQYFRDFRKSFRSVQTRVLRTNYRSTRSIVQVGNDLMSGLGVAAVAASKAPEGQPVWLCDLGSFAPSEAERKRDGGDVLLSAAIRLVSRFLQDDRSVALLSRTNAVPRLADRSDAVGIEMFVERVREHLPEDSRRRAGASTVHKFKGLQEQAVVVVDAIDGRFPLIHPAWVFLRLFGENPEKIREEERRLFYVALTRAERSLAILTDRPRASPFIKDIEEEWTGRIEWLDWEDLPPIQGAGESLVEVVVFFGFEIKDALKKRSFHWHSEDKSWRKAVPVGAIDLQGLFSGIKVPSKTRIEVRSQSGEVLQTRTPKGDGLT